MCSTIPSFNFRLRFFLLFISMDLSLSVYAGIVLLLYVMWAPSRRATHTLGQHLVAGRLAAGPCVLLLDRIFTRKEG